MNRTYLTPSQKDLLFTFICYGRATPANVARLFNIDRRTAQRLTKDENLVEIIPDPTKGDIARWYALFDPGLHSWRAADGAFHIEARTAVSVRDDLAFLVQEMVGDTLKRRMIEECPQKSLRELRRDLENDFNLSESGIMRQYHYATPPTFKSIDGRDI